MVCCARMDHYAPDMDRLPLLIVSLARDVQWQRETECFATLCQVLPPHRHGAAEQPGWREQLRAWARWGGPHLGLCACQARKTGRQSNTYSPVTRWPADCWE